MKPKHIYISIAVVLSFIAIYIIKSRLYIDIFPNRHLLIFKE